jgi:hypothetical protein
LGFLGTDELEARNWKLKVQNRLKAQKKKPWPGLKHLLQ